MPTVPGSVNQGHLVNCVKSIFPNVQTQLNVKKSSDLQYPERSIYLELDVWLPQEQICFEFQDTYHYISTWYAHITQDRILQKDNIKKTLVRRKGIYLVEVPCWWNGSKERLESTINFQRPDLVISKTDPISLNPPIRFFPSPEIPEVGELMLASFPMDSTHAINLPITPNAWWIGEKYDGVRCCWNSQRRKVYARSSKELELLRNVVTLLPKNLFIDGELWFGRGNFVHSYPLVTGSANLVQWDTMRIVAFDCPSKSQQKLSFENRYHELLQHSSLDHPFIMIAPRFLCKDNIFLHAALHAIVDNGGEGVVMRKVGSFYECGRSPALLKLKKNSCADMEGIVESIENASIKLKLPTGKKIWVPQTSCMIPTPALGDIVTFSYTNRLQNDIIVGPTIIRLRTDLTWEDLVANAAKEKQFAEENKHVGESGRNKHSNWSIKNVRALLERFARQKNLDPLQPSTWYKFRYSDIFLFKSGSTVLQKFKGYFNILQQAFPDVTFDSTAFIHSPWRVIENRRKFFENYAREHGFDPLVPENWYLQPRKRIANYKGASRVVAYHRGSISRALMDLFPNIGLERSKLYYLTPWSELANRRKFFEEYAKSNGFDPLIPTNWYTQPSDKIMLMKGAHNVIRYHQNTITQALLDLFPNIGLDNAKFLDWFKRRAVFEAYAKEAGFDPLSAENWMSQPKKSILKAMGQSEIISFYKSSVSTALLDLFPDIGLGNRKRKRTSL